MLRHRRSGALLGSLILFVACLAPATASAQRCTVGVDISAAQDRYPSACARFELPPGLRAVGPTASGPGNGVTVFAWFDLAFNFVSVAGNERRKLAEEALQTLVA